MNMPDDGKLIKNRFLELAKRAESRGVYAYTPFLGLLEQDTLSKMKRELSFIPCEAFGGAEGCERVMVRFGNEETLGYAEPFPIKCLFAEPLNRRFADKLTHRDILGALMGLGIEREVLGDIVIREFGAYIFCAESIAEHIKENFTQAKHTDLKVSFAERLPDGELFKLTPCELTVASERLDCTVAAYAKLSRGDASELITKGLVFVNGAQVENGSKQITENSVVSVRGYGRFIFKGEQRRTRKDRLVVRIEKYE